MTDYPQFAFDVDEENRTWRLLRQMKTEQYAIARKPTEETEPGEFIWQSKEQADVEDRDDDGLVPVRDEFLDAVGALFLRGPGGRDWELSPIFDALEWYEDEVADDLRSLRYETQRGRAPEEFDEADGEPRTMASGAWDLVKQARSEFTLTGSLAYKPGEQKSAKERDEPHENESTLGDF